MKEQLIDFETAKLAKEKGFTLGVRDFGGIDYYKPNGEKLKLEEYSKEFVKFCTLYCTQSILQKWLRETHGIKLWPTPHEYSSSDGWAFNLLAYKEGVVTVFKGNQASSVHLTYEQAIEEGLKEALKHI